MNGHRGFDTFIGPDDTWLLRQQNRLLRHAKRTFGESFARNLEIQRILATEKGDSAVATAHATRLIESSNKPFFGFVVLMDPHAMYHPARREFCGDSTALSQFLREINGRQMYASIMARGGSLAPRLRQTAVDMYDAEVKHADRFVGRLVDCLARRDQLDNTFLVICADHGEGFGEHGVWGHGFALHEFMTRVPLIVRHPATFEPGSRSNALVQLHALHDTCLHLSGGLQSSDSSHKAGFDESDSLLRVADSTWNGSEFVFSEFPMQSGTLAMMHRLNPNFEPGRWASDMWSVRSSQWRLIEYDNGERELYDLVSDPHETNSVHEKYAEKCGELSEHLRAHRQDRPTKSSNPDAPEQVDEAVLDRLRALGYID